MLPPRSIADWLADSIVLEGVTLADHLEDCPSCWKPRRRCRVGAFLLECTPASPAWRLPERRHVLGLTERGFLDNARRRAARRLGPGQLIPPPAVDREILEILSFGWVRTADLRFARWTRSTDAVVLPTVLDRVELNLETRMIRARATARISGTELDVPEASASLGDVIRLRAEVERWVEATP